MPTRLSDLKAVEVSIVPRGANKQQFLVVKEDEGMSPIEKALKDAGVDLTLSAEVLKAMDGAACKAMPEKTQSVLKSAVRMLKAVEGDLPEGLLAQLLAAAGLQCEPADAGVPAATTEPAAKADPGAGDVHVEQPMEAPVKKEDGSWDFSKVPAAVRPVLESVWKERAESDKKLAAVQKALDEERDARVTKEFVEKAANFRALGVGNAELGKVLKEIHEKAPGAYKALEPMLKSFDEKIAKGGVFSEIGTSAAGAAIPTAGQTEAEAKIEQIAKGFVEKSDGKTTREAAVAKAWQMNPGLYSEHRAEVTRRQRGA